MPLSLGLDLASLAARGARAPAASWADTLAAQTAVGTSNNWTGYTLFQEIPAAYLTNSGTQVRLTIQNAIGGGGAANTITHICIAEQAGSGDPYDRTGTIAEFLFSGVAGYGFTSFGETAVSDPLTFTIDETKTHIITAYMSVAPGLAIATGSLGGTVRSWSYHADLSNTADVSGAALELTTSFTLVKRMEVR